MKFLRLHQLQGSKFEEVFQQSDADGNGLLENDELTHFVSRHSRHHGCFNPKSQSNDLDDLGTPILGNLHLFVH